MTDPPAELVEALEIIDGAIGNGGFMSLLEGDPGIYGRALPDAIETCRLLDDPDRARVLEEFLPIGPGTATGRAFIARDETGGEHPDALVDRLGQLDERYFALAPLELDLVAAPVVDVEEPPGFDAEVRRLADLTLARGSDVEWDDRAELERSIRAHCLTWLSNADGEQVTPAGLEASWLAAAASYGRR